MKQSVFNNGSKHDTRDIMIRIDDTHIEFFFYEQYLRQKQWIEDETERRFQEGQDELLEDEAGNHGFYWIGTDDWHKSKKENLDRPDNWHNHMKEKNWFTKEMKSFLDLNTF